MTQERRLTHRWQPLTDLPENWRDQGSPELATLASIWREQASDLKKSDALKRFQERLSRQWAIETGIIEGLYKIDRGITELLIEKGIESSLIPHGSTDRPAAEVIEILRDHENVLDGLFDFVSSGRGFSTSYAKQLHQALCEHQHYIEGRNALGQPSRTPLSKGEWKKWPNNPSRPDGSTHEYCPPEQVASEMDRLVEYHGNHLAMDVPPEIEAAWLHHRFAQIHPFQDGNGRVARALASLVLLRGGLFPFVVLRDDRDSYIKNLEAADNGDLRPLVEMIAVGQRRMLKRALSISDEVLGVDRNVKALIDAVAERLHDKEKERARMLESVFELSKDLEEITFDRMENLATDLAVGLRGVNIQYTCYAEKSDASQSHWYRFQVVEVARKLEYFADLRRYHHWVRLRIREQQNAEVVFSFHPLGKDFRGIMAVTGFFETRLVDQDDREAAVPQPACICRDAFEFNYLNRAEEIRSRFEHWLEESLIAGLEEWKQGM
ncbi:Fic family protein [Candidatus Poribacteria bacterium]|nr:Fic family protein [Candidatus Poribacteria bacterium]